MKKFLAIFLFLFLKYSAQNLSIAYEINFRPDINNKNYFESDVCLLDIINSKSYFYSPLFNNEEKRLEVFKDDESLKSKLLKSLKTTYIIEKNYNDNSLIYFLKLDEIYGYKDDFKFNWKIDKSSNTNILGYNCSSASTEFRGRKYTAFFTTDLPINDGPYKFKDLPGLILKVQSNDGDYSFTAIAIEKKGDKLDLKLNNSFLTSRKKYLKLMSELAKDPSKNLKLKDLSNTSDYKTYISGKEVSKEEKYKMYNKMIWNFMKIHNNPLEKNDIWIR